jgi:hypothetical protein
MPTGTRAKGVSPDDDMLNISSVPLGVFTANNLVWSGDMASGRTRPDSNSMNEGAPGVCACSFVSKETVPRTSKAAIHAVPDLSRRCLAIRILKPEQPLSIIDEPSCPEKIYRKRCCTAQAPSRCVHGRLLRGNSGASVKVPFSELQSMLMFKTRHEQPFRP